MDHIPVRRATQAWRRADLEPTPAERRALEEISRRGGLVVAYGARRRTVSSADGRPISRLGVIDIDAAIEVGWLTPDPGSPSLWPDLPAQKYFVDQRLTEEGRR